MKLQEKEAKLVQELFVRFQAAQAAARAAQQRFVDVVTHIASREDVDLKSHIFDPEKCEFVPAPEEPQAVEQPKVD